MSIPEAVHFDSYGETCAADYYRAPGEGPHPIVVMGHGLGATKELGLQDFAEHFAAAGISALAFDYRHYGASTGTPRELLSIKKQLEDFRNAIAFARTLPGVDPQRVAIWGSSFAGGHVMQLAAEDLGLRAGVSQVPFSSGLASTRCIPPWTALRMTGKAIVDLTRSALGLGPTYVPLLGHPGEVAMMSAQDSYDGYKQLVPQAAVDADRWHNRVAARIALGITFYEPARALKKARIPVFVATADTDTIAPAEPTKKAARQTPNATLFELPKGHFDYYKGEGGALLASEELAFLQQHLLSP